MNVRDWEFWLHIMIFVFACFHFGLQCVSAFLFRYFLVLFANCGSDLWTLSLFAIIAWQRERELLFDPRNLIHNSKKRRRR